MANCPGLVWTIVAVIFPEGSPVLWYRMPMAMNNGGDTIELVNPQGQVVQTVTYPGADEGEKIFPGQ